MGFFLPPPIRPISFSLDAEEHRELGEPLVEELLAVHEDERAPPALRHEVGAEDRLADAGRRDEDAGVVLEEGARGRLLGSA